MRRSRSLSPATPSPFLDTPVDEMREMARKELCIKSLAHFSRGGWHTFEGQRRLDWGWHMDCICDHLEAVARGEIRRLIINMPPRHCKSTLMSVMFPAWLWLQEPYKQFLFTSYSADLTTRDNVKCRRLLDSPWFLDIARYAYETDAEKNGEKETWHLGPFRFERDQNTTTRYTNIYGGSRIATSVDGKATGEGGDIIVVDDPNNVKQVESDIVRESTNTWWDETMQSRLNDARSGAFVIIQQRTHENDLTGHVQYKYGHAAEHSGGYHFLKLPARYEGNKTISTFLNWEDPREEEGEALFPERFDDKILSEMEQAFGDYASAGQLQQRPAPRQGGLIKPDFIHTCYEPPFKLTHLVRYWDFAATGKNSKKRSTSTCYTAGVLLGKMMVARKRPGWIILDVVHGQWEPYKRDQIIQDTAEQDASDYAGRVKIYFEQEPGSAGKEVAQDKVAKLAGYSVHPDRPTGEKSVRAEPFGIQVENGNIWVLTRPWTNPYLSECRTFPNGRFKDQVDATSGAFNLMCNRKRAGTWGPDDD